MEIKRITRQGIIATIYIVVSLALAPLSFGAIQFRMAEMMMVLPYYNKKNTIGLTIGCLIANMFSPMGTMDMVFGTVATFITCMMIANMNSKRYIAVVAGIVNGVIVGAELFLVLGLPLLFSIATVAAGEICVVLVGVLLFSLLEKNGVTNRI